MTRSLHPSLMQGAFCLTISLNLLRILFLRTEQPIFFPTHTPYRTAGRGSGATYTTMCRSWNTVPDWNKSENSFFFFIVESRSTGCLMHRDVFSLSAFSS